MSYEDYLESRNLKLYLNQIARFPVYTEEGEKSWPPKPIRETVRPSGSSSNPT